MGRPAAATSQLHLYSPTIDVNTSTAGCLTLSLHPGRTPWTCCPSMRLQLAKGSCELGFAPCHPSPLPHCWRPGRLRNALLQAVAARAVAAAATVMSCGVRTWCCPSYRM